MDETKTLGRPFTPPPILHPALELQAGFASVGILDAVGLPWLVQSDGETFKKCDPKALPRNGRVVPSPLAYKGLRGRWPDDDLSSFLANPTSPGFQEAVEQVRDTLLYYLEFASPDHATLCACWIVGTYLHQIFTTFPRLNFHGERGSGKTKSLQIIAALAFNGLHFIDPTPANLFRLIEALRCTLCLDEMEGLDGSDHKAIYSILNAGYKAGATVPRIEGDDRRPEGFEVYAPVAFGSITGINAVTADRAVTLQMARGTDQSTINRVVDPREPQFGAIRASLYRLALIHGPKLSGLPLTALVPPFITGRHRELFLPLLVIAELAGGAPFRDDVFRVSMQSLGERESLPEEGRALFYSLEWRLIRSPQLTIYPGDLAEEISDALGMDTDRGKRLEPRKVGSLLKRYGFKRGQETNKGIPYTMTRSRFRELAGLYSYPIAEDFPGG